MSPQNQLEGGREGGREGECENERGDGLWCVRMCMCAIIIKGGRMLERERKREKERERERERVRERERESLREVGMCDLENE